eukprot:4465611-Amphidinium_carterae.1
MNEKATSVPVHPTPCSETSVLKPLVGLAPPLVDTLLPNRAEVGELEERQGGDEGTGEELAAARRSLQDMTAKASLLSLSCLHKRCAVLRASGALCCRTSRLETTLVSPWSRADDSASHRAEGQVTHMSEADLGLSEVAVLPRVDGRSLKEMMYAWWSLVCGAASCQLSIAEMNQHAQCDAMFLVPDAL